MLNIDGVIFSLTSTDILFHLGTEEIALRLVPKNYLVLLHFLVFLHMVAILFLIN